MPMQERNKNNNEEDLEKQKTITEASLLREGARYIIVRDEHGKREKCLELTEGQIEKARQEMMKSLEQRAKLNEFLEKIGVEPDDFAVAPRYSTYELVRSLEGERQKLNLCCFDPGHIEDGDIGKLLKILYKNYPNLRSQKLFVLYGLNGGSHTTAIVRGDNIDPVNTMKYGNAFINK